jgi:hypothetical protein
VLNNIDVWLDRIPSCAESIRKKVDSGFEENNFKSFAFIDNTSISTCRPGRRPRVDGHRNNLLLQRAFYNGWKSIHGLKVQTIDLPNGCNFHVSRPYSLRHNDIWTFHQSNIDHLLTELQLNSVKKFKSFGDSAYTVLGLDSCVSYRIDDAHGNDAIVNRAISSCCESVEWNYGD